MKPTWGERTKANATAIQSAQLTPNEVREREGNPKSENPAADELHIQGATVVLGSKSSEPQEPSEPEPDDAEDTDQVDDGGDTDEQ